ncbi:hypothetical protein Gohar_019603 [Gossypium harknessii]|uniref:Uncharacterized protein n=1 Tax=Gossypium harknessii TaxID=34285 RepID=A0A7J9I6H0_9ROSI|nr:hypothetical protein [Gossypium harknessii]
MNIGRVIAFIEAYKTKSTSIVKKIATSAGLYNSSGHHQEQTRPNAILTRLTTVICLNQSRESCSEIVKDLFWHRVLTTTPF